MDVLGGFKILLKVQKTVIDNCIFQLHYKASLLFLLACSALISANQYFGDPITCQTITEIPEKLLNTYCWIHSTFTIPTAFYKPSSGDSPYPGVGQYIPGKDRVFHAYYQWVGFVLLLQGALFYIPRLIWKVVEGGKIENLSSGLKKPIVDEDTKKKQIGLLVTYIMQNFHGHGTYSTLFVICEILNLVNVIGQIFLMDSFLDGQFTTYGPKVVQFASMDQENRTDPMIRVFPRMTKCNYFAVGRSGDVQKFDTLCILPLNIVNEKIYIFAWFWFVILAAITGICLIYRLVVITNSSFRLHILLGRSRLTPSKYIKAVTEKCDLGDWFLLLLLAKNMNPHVFHDFIVDVARQLNGETLPKTPDGDPNMKTMMHTLYPDVPKLVDDMGSKQISV